MPKETWSCWSINDLGQVACPLHDCGCTKGACMLPKKMPPCNGLGRGACPSHAADALNGLLAGQEEVTLFAGLAISLLALWWPGLGCVPFLWLHSRYLLDTQEGVALLADIVMALVGLRALSMHMMAWVRLPDLAVVVATLKGLFAVQEDAGLLAGLDLVYWLCDGQGGAA